MGIVICKLPNAGLGNQLFPLIKAYTFAHLNQLPVTVINYRQLKIGPWLRREKSKRNYKGFFVFQKKNFSIRINRRDVKKLMDKVPVGEPEIKLINGKSKTDESYIFSSMPHWSNYFAGLKENRRLAIELFWKIVDPEIQQQLSMMQAPYIGVHIRMGDFRKLKNDEEFGKAGNIRTPEKYFVDVINGIRKIHGSLLPVSVFTDGHTSELAHLFSLENISTVEGNNDLLDLLHLSRSKIIVTSATSTFSYWSAFLSSALVIMHPAHIHESLRPEVINNQLFEGAFDKNNERLVSRIRAITNDK